MALSGGIFDADASARKKNDDDPKSMPGSASSTPWAGRKPFVAVRRRRLAYILCGLAFIFLFIKNIPSDIGPHPRWADSRTYKGPTEDKKPPPIAKTSWRSSSSKKPPPPLTPSPAQEHYHDGPIKFYKLAASLHAAAKLGGQRLTNRNVLFAAADLKSLSELIPIACEMAKWDRNDVHLAFIGREEIGIDEIQVLNGAEPGSCGIHWHDARPDFSRWSSEIRMHTSVTAALGHMHEFLHPQVLLIDDALREEEFFIAAARSKASDHGLPLIELPPDATERMMWISRLDSSSMAAWTRIKIEIVIQPPPNSAGTVVRLLKSIEGASYLGPQRPHLTIELPENADQDTWTYLENMVWPPRDWSESTHVSQLTLRHRIPRQTISPEEASARFVESFFPDKPMDTHVLVLSPQVELSPLYYHYLFFSLLQYRYSTTSSTGSISTNIAGISLDLPTTLLDGTTTFKPPVTTASDHNSSMLGLLDQPSFLWQAPNSNAVLYYGEKWMELHSFVTGRVSKPPSKSPRYVSKKYPTWLEYMQELMRARAWSVIYPGQFAGEFVLSTMHKESFQIPEEYIKKPSSVQDALPLLRPDQTLEADPASGKGKSPHTYERSLIETTLTSLLPMNEPLQELHDMALIAYDGMELSLTASMSESKAFADKFKEEIGTCAGGKNPQQYQWTKATDLYCHLEDVYDHYAAAGPMSYPDHPSSGEVAKPKAAELQSDEKNSSLPENDDSIQANKPKDVDHEVAAHLDRQAGHTVHSESQNTASFIDVVATTSLDPRTISPTSSALAADFQSSDLGKTGTKTVSEAVMAASTSSLAPVAASSTPSEVRQPKRGAFDKGRPKPPSEDDLIGGRSPGWR